MGILFSFVLFSCSNTKVDLSSKDKPIVNVTAKGYNANVHLVFDGFIDGNNKIVNTFGKVTVSASAFSAIIATGSQFKIDVKMAISNAKAHEPTKHKNDNDEQGYFTSTDTTKPIIVTLINENGFTIRETTTQKKLVDKINLETKIVTTNKVIKTMRGTDMTGMLNDAIESLNTGITDNKIKLENISALKID